MFSLTFDFESQVETTEVYSKTKSKEEITVSAIVSRSLTSSDFNFLSD